MDSRYKFFEDRRIVFRSNESFMFPKYKDNIIRIQEDNVYYKFYDAKKEFYYNPFSEPIASRNKFAWTMRLLKHLNPWMGEDLFHETADHIVHNNQLCTLAYRENNGGVFIDDDELSAIVSLSIYIWRNKGELENRVFTSIVFNYPLLYKAAQHRIDTMDNEYTGEELLNLLYMYKQANPDKYGDWKLDDIRSHVGSREHFDYSVFLKEGEQLTSDKQLKLEVRFLKSAIRRIVLQNNYELLIEEAMNDIHDAGEKITYPKIAGTIGVSRATVVRRMSKDQKDRKDVMNIKADEIKINDAYDKLSNEMEKVYITSVFNKLGRSVDRDLVSKVVKIRWSKSESLRS